MLNEATMSKLNAMKLYGMAKAYSELQLTAKAGDLTADEALAMLVDREQLDRDNRSTAKGLLKNN